MQLEGYSNLTKFATGGMAAVYKARQDSLNRTVAIKFLSAEHLWDDDATQSFDQESLVIAQLNHPNIIHIIDRGRNEKGRPYFVMEYIQGSELSQVIQQEKLTLNDKINLLIQICKGMATAHKNGVIHRDIKPSNIIIDADNNLHILDFGIAWLAANGNPENIVGTPNYMSPEQFTHPGNVTHLTDIYSLGVIMYEIFFNQLPPGNNEKLASSLENLPVTLGNLIAQCLKIKPEERPATADEIHLQLLKVVNGSHLNQKQKIEANKAINNSSNKFSLLDIIKQTEFGIVYLFEDNTRKNLLVIKKCIKSFAGYNEAKLLSKLKHENIVHIYGTSKSNKAFIIVMEHLASGSLEDRLVRKFKQKHFLHIAIPICKAICFAHDANISHGNLRPSNILFNEKNNVKVSDFGLNEHYTNTLENSDWYQPNDKGGSSKSRDLYSLGAIFYRMLTGQQINFSNKRIQSCDAFDKLTPLLQNIIRNLMEEDTKNHYQSIDQLLPDLHEISATANINKNIKTVSISRLLKLILGLLLANGLIISSLIYFKPEYLEKIKQLIGL